MAATSAAQAGAFALREQSAAGQGLSFAGAAAGGAGLASMFWNPATLTGNKGIQTSVGLTGIIPYINLTNVSGTGAGYAAFNGKSTSGDMAQDAIVPNSYLSWQFDQNIWLGLSVNAPYGSATKPDSSYVGRTYGSTSRASSKEVTASIAYKFNEMISVAAGVRYLDLKARYTTGAPTGLNATDWAILDCRARARLSAIRWASPSSPWIPPRSALAIARRSSRPSRVISSAALRRLQVLAAVQL